MLALAGALLAGVLTTLAPCVLPLLPVIVGGSLATDGDRAAARRRAVLVAVSLGVSVIVFTLLLRATTLFIGIDQRIWSLIAGGLLVVLGVLMVFPEVWDRISGRAGLQQRTTALLSGARQREGVAGAVLTGAALGPVFSSCSPLYGYVIVTVLPTRFGWGLALLAAYVVGLCATLLVIALAGQRVLRRVGWLADPHSAFRRFLGLIFVLVGLLVMAGLDRDLQAWIIEHSPVRPWELDRGFIPK